MRKTKKQHLREKLEGLAERQAARVAKRKSDIARWKNPPVRIRVERMDLATPTGLQPDDAWRRAESTHGGRRTSNKGRAA